MNRPRFISIDWRARGELARGAVALVLVLREGLQDDALELDGVAADEGRRLRDVALLDLRERVEVAVHPEEALAGGQLPKDDAQREDVGPAVDVFAGDLLGRHVRELALERAVARRGHARAELRDAEVHDLRRPVVRHEEVVRRHVAVDEIELLAILALQLVGSVQALGGVGDDAARNLGGHRRAELLGAAHDLAERLAVQVLHGDPEAVGLLAEVEDRRDVRVRDARRDARLVEEHLDEALVLDEVGVDALDGDPLLEAARPVDAREVNARHAADADFVDDAVAAEQEGPSLRRRMPTGGGLRARARGRGVGTRSVGASGVLSHQWDCTMVAAPG